MRHLSQGSLETLGRPAGRSTSVGPAIGVVVYCLIAVGTVSAVAGFWRNARLVIGMRAQDREIQRLMSAPLDVRSDAFVGRFLAAVEPGQQKTHWLLVFLPSRDGGQNVRASWAALINAVGRPASLAETYVVIRPDRGRPARGDDSRRSGDWSIDASDALALLGSSDRVVSLLSDSAHTVRFMLIGRPDMTMVDVVRGAIGDSPHEGTQVRYGR